MKFLLNFILFSLTTIFFENSAYSLTNYQIKLICNRKETKLSCIKNLKLKKDNFIKGNRIEIPVIPYKK